MQMYDADWLIGQMERVAAAPLNPRTVLYDAKDKVASIAYVRKVRQHHTLTRLSSLRGLACYLASPYTNYPDGHAAAAHAATTVAAALTRMGLSVYSPIVSGHAICRVSDIDSVDASLWQRIDQPWVDAAQACIVATLPGWDTSRGIAHEVASFLAAGKPVIYVDPQSL